MLSKVFVHSPIKLWSECAYSLLHEEILKSLHRLKLSDCDLSVELNGKANKLFSAGCPIQFNG